jgi:hypothetical protein
VLGGASVAWSWNDSTFETVIPSPEKKPVVCWPLLIAIRSATTAGSSRSAAL